MEFVSQSTYCITLTAIVSPKPQLPAGSVGNVVRLPGRSGFRTSSAPPHWLRTFSIFFALATSQGPSRPWQAYNWEIIPSCPRPFSEDTASADTTKGEPRPKRLTLHTGYGWVYVRDEEEGLLLYYYPLPLEHVPHSSSHADSDILATL